VILHDCDPGGSDRAVKAGARDPRQAVVISRSRAKLTSSQRTFISHADNTAALPSARNKGNKAIEREVISSYQVAQSLGFNGDFRAWEHLLRIHE
jgi:hypothetical protein